jgi:hypothetical protein
MMMRFSILFFHVYPFECRIKQKDVKARRRIEYEVPAFSHLPHPQSKDLSAASPRTYQT